MSVETLANLCEELNSTGEAENTKRRRKLLKVVPLEREEEILAIYKGHSLMLTSRTTGIAMPALVKFLESKKAMRGRGQFVAGAAPRQGKPRSKPIVDDAMVREALTAHDEHGIGFVKFSKGKNLNAVELTDKIKELGYPVKRGRRKITA